MTMIETPNSLTSMSRRERELAHCLSPFRVRYRGAGKTVDAKLAARLSEEADSYQPRIKVWERGMLWTLAYRYRHQLPRSLWGEEWPE